MTAPEHVLTAVSSPAGQWACSCGGWQPELGESVYRAFDRHLLEVRG